MLLALREFVQRHHVVSAEQLAREFKIAVEALEPMLNIWINKGLLKKTNKGDNCGSGCNSCKPKARQLNYYEWRE